MKEKTINLNQITLVEKLFIVILIVFTVAFLYIEYGYIPVHPEILVLPITSLIVIAIIFLKFSLEKKVIISITIGFIGLTALLVVKSIVTYNPFHVYYDAISTISFLGTFYGILGLKSKNKKLAISGIILNISQIIMIGIPIHKYLYIK